MTDIGHSEKVLVMRVFIAVLVLIFCFQSLSSADEINDLEINEMSLGESALKYYSKSEIIANKKNWYKNDEYSTSEIDNIQISYKTKDSRYTLVAINKTEEMGIDKCNKEIINIVTEVENVVNKKLDGPIKSVHWADKSNKSYLITYNHFFSNNDYIAIECYDWSKNVNWRDHLRVSIVKYGFKKFLSKQ